MLRRDYSTYQDDELRNDRYILEFNKSCFDYDYGCGMVLSSECGTQE